MEYRAIIKRIFIILILGITTYLSTTYFHLVSINKFCVENSYGIPFEELAPKIEAFSFLTNVRYIKGYMDEKLWVDPEFEINSILSSEKFGCNLLVGFKSTTDDSIVTIGHYKLEEFGYKFIKISLL